MERIALIGHGEAARAFVAGGLPATAAYDIDSGKRDGIAAGDDPAAVLADATLVLSLVTADRALEAAQRYAPLLKAGARWCDLNSVAPATKRAAAKAVEAAGATYLDVAVMAPVEPKRLAVPLLVSGADAAAAAERLREAGFSHVSEVGDAVGRAAAIKLIRSVMIKGTEALTAEMVLAARAAGVEEEVLASLDDGWSERAAYNLERMTRHGRRRAAEMEEAAATLQTLGIEPLMTRGTIRRQREMAEQGQTA